MKTSSISCGLLSLAALASAKVYEAESAKLEGVNAATSVGGFGGEGYVEGFDVDTDKITFDVEEEEGLYELGIRYNGIFGDKFTSVALNGAGAAQVSLPASTEWKTVSGGQVKLKAGANTIEIRSNWGWYLIDSISLEPAEDRPPHQVSPDLVNPNANGDAKALHKYLTSIYGKNILSGQQDAASLQQIVDLTGKTPAVLGVDLMDYTESRKSRGANSKDVDAAIAHAQKGGIVTFCWHWGAPTGLYDTPEQPWYRGFYTDATDFNVETALADTTNANYTLLVEDIDTIAVELLKLQDAGVPVLWRPLHEAEGKWFWWGAKGPEACKKLWALVYDRLTNYHKVNNLIWTWNSLAPEWYPGPETADILSTDVYAQGDHGPMSKQYNDLIKLGEDKRIIAATEVGSIPDPDQLQEYKADWVYFCTWSGDFINGDSWNPPDYIKRVYEHEYVLNLDEIQGWKGGSPQSRVMRGI